MLTAALLIVGGFTPAVTAQEAPPRSPTLGGIADKPFAKNFSGGIALGGYIDHEFRMRGGSSTFDQHRFIPFIFARPVEFIHVGAEIEFEHGGFVTSGQASGVDTDDPPDGQIDKITNSTTDGEIKLEFAAIDWLIADGFNFRGGVILSPLGRFNLMHDSPLNDLTSRPLITRRLIPTTLSESGMGVFGVAYPGEWVVAYQLYAVNGFNSNVIDAEGRLRVRGGRGSQKADNNENKAVVGRLSASPALGVDIGVSAHSGAYDDNGEHNLTIAALDADWQRGRFQLLGEAALVSADIDRTRYPNAADRQAGFYAQANVHFGFGVIPRYPDGAFTGVVRFDHVDFDRDRDGDDARILTLGINLRPVEATVAKLDYRWEWARDPGQTVWSVPDHQFSFSLATYF